ncbi:hypothetical protein [Okeania sp.]|uniref:hypothetical protein n=1 Tax=Okeania sp. TaxID=3100323 RepID=UPI002B4B9121|nr:hypothetical protein [Okeania sp.]MEB3343604.1 hypothetical protein [Okeania sp.]
MKQPTTQDQYMVELINISPIEPAGEVDYYEIDRNETVSAQNTIYTTPKKTLAFKLNLNTSRL